jgi:hypothetical protein
VCDVSGTMISPKMPKNEAMMRVMYAAEELILALSPFNKLWKLTGVLRAARHSKGTTRTSLSSGARQEEKCPTTHTISTQDTSL